MVTLRLPLPQTLEPGRYSATVADAMSDLRADVMNRSHLLQPSDYEGLLDFLKMQLAVRRTDLAMRFDPPRPGLAIEGTELPNLPAGVSEILAQDASRRSQPIQSSLVARAATPWVVEGQVPIRFEVVKEKKLNPPPARRDE